VHQYQPLFIIASSSSSCIINNLFSS